MNFCIYVYKTIDFFFFPSFLHSFLRFDMCVYPIRARKPTFYIVLLCVTFFFFLFFFFGLMTRDDDLKDDKSIRRPKLRISVFFFFPFFHVLQKYFFTLFFVKREYIVSFKEVNLYTCVFKIREKRLANEHRTECDKYCIALAAHITCGNIVERVRCCCCCCCFFHCI